MNKQNSDLRSIDIHTYPSGPAVRLYDDTLVQRLQVVAGRLRFVDDYAGSLDEGDEYWIPDLVYRAPWRRTADEILNWMEDEAIDTDFERDVDGCFKSVSLYNQSGQNLVSYPYGEYCLREACEFVMDQEERNG